MTEITEAPSQLHSDGMSDADVPPKAPLISFTTTTKNGNLHAIQDFDPKMSIIPDIVNRRKTVLKEHAHKCLDFSRAGLIGRENELATLDRFLKYHFHGHDAGHRNASGSRNDKQENKEPTRLLTRKMSLAKQSERSLVLLSGLSGTGKSTLVSQLQPKVMARNGFYISTKFDFQETTQEPLFGIRAAMSDLCHRIAKLATDDGDQLFQELRNRILQGLGKSELQILSKHVSTLADVVGTDHCNPSFTDSTDNTSRNVSSENISSGGDDKISYQKLADQLKFIISRFIEIVASFCPMVWVLDDLQWADRSSLEIVRWCLIDGKISSLLMVGTYRSDAYEHSHCAATVKSLEECKHGRSLRIETIKINNFHQSQVRELLIRILNPKTPEVVDALASIIYNKTDGNVFFIQQFIRELIQRELLSYDIGFAEWSWTDDDVRIKSPITSNVVELMTAKLHDIKAAQLLLPLVACLGYTSSVLMLRLVIRGFADHSGQASFFEKMFGEHPSKVEESLTTIVDICLEEGLIEKSCNPQYDDHDISQSISICFTHDKVQEASLGLLEEDQVPELKYKIGDILIETLSLEELDTHLFTIVNLINSRLDMVPKHVGKRCNHRRLKIAQLNYQAGCKSVTCSAFRTAAIYFKNAIDLLPIDHWERHFELSLQLFSSAAECAFVNSDFQQLEFYSGQVLSLDMPTLSKMRVYQVLVGCHAMIETPKGSSFDPIQIGVGALRSLGCAIPKRKFGQTFQTIRGMVALPSKVKKRWSPEAFQMLPETTDPRSLAIMKLIGTLSDACYLANSDLLALVVLVNAKVTFKVGLAAESPPAFALLGLILNSFMNDLETGTSYAKYALELVEKMDFRSTECRTVSTCYSGVLHWTQSFQSCKLPLLKAYTVGMSTGDIEPAIWCIFHHIWFGLVGGTFLVDLENDISTYARLSQDYKQAKQTWFLMMSWQVVLNLMGEDRLGENANPSVLVGKAYDEKEAMLHFELVGDTLMKYGSQSARIMLAVIFADFQRAADIACEGTDAYYKTLAGSCVMVPHSCNAAIAGFALSRTSKNKKYIKMARKCRAKLKEWTTKGCPNTIHRLEMVNGEKRASEGKTHLAKQHFETAIRLTGRQGLIPDQALANERLAEMFACNEDLDNAKYRFDEALRLYDEWGAKRKVSHLQRRLQNIWPPSTKLWVGFAMVRKTETLCRLCTTNLSHIISKFVFLI